LSDIFISYAEEDREQARRLAEALKAQGWSVFWDRTILPGKTWRQVIDTALHEARCVIVAWSEASIQSSWVCEEADEGRERKVLVPVLLGAVKPPRGFRAIQAASLVNWDGHPTAEEFQQLVSAIADILGPPKQPAAPRPPPQEAEPAPTQQPESPAPRESPREKGRKGQRPTLWIAGLALGVVIAGLVSVQTRRPESPQRVKPVEETAEVTRGGALPEPQPEEAETARKSAVIGEVPSASPKDARALCRPRRSGSMQPGREQRLPIGGAMRLGRTAPTALAAAAGGMTSRQRRWARSRRTPGGCMTQRATCGSGYRIATMTVTKVHQRTVQRGRRAGVPCACSVAVPGATGRGTCARRAGAGASRTTGTTSLGFVSPRMSISPFFFILFPFPL
jgi:TIR domain-containing protein